MIATNDRPAVVNTVDVADVSPVRSRISWAAILGGGVVAIAAYLLYTFLTAALGVSLTAAGVRADAVAIGAVVVAVVGMAGALFLGGWVTTQLSVGENSREAAIYGVLTWAVVTGITLFMLGSGIRTGYLALMDTTLVAQNNPAVQQRNWEDLARDAGYNPQDIENLKAKVDPKNVRAQVEDPATQEKLKRGTVTAAWALVGGTLLSIAAAIGGALVGRGPRFRLFPMLVAERRGEVLRS